MKKDKLTAGSLLVALGIVFGDIGTSPLYVFTAISEGKHFDPQLILGSLSCVFWTLMILASLKYIYLALNNDNHGEGGIFALYALLRSTNSKWIIFPALIGCATLMSDGFLTPAISISSAVEGLNQIFPALPTLPIVVSIIIGLFLMQQFGTQAIGKIFGPVMLLWFLTLGALGINQIILHPGVLVALNPMYAFDFLGHYPGAIWILGAVFLCTTGAEALYSDLGHCGKNNIRISWAFVMVMLLINYFGQAAFCLNLPAGTELTSVFYSTVPAWFLPYSIGIATMASVIASQALITGIFTLVNEAIKLRLWTTLKIKYPTTEKGQIYIPAINYFLMFGCLGVLALFRKSTNMEAAYGVAITIDMLMTTSLMGFLFLVKKEMPKWLIFALITLFVLVEGTFLVSNLGKVAHGGWFSILAAASLFAMLYLYYRARNLRQLFSEYLQTKKLLPKLTALIEDEKIPYLATNLVYPARTLTSKKIDATIAYSLFNMSPKRAQTYWFLHVDITDLPNGVHYQTETILPQRCFYINLRLGFKEEHHIAEFMKGIHKDLVKKGLVSGESVFESMQKNGVGADFKYVLINSRMVNDFELSPIDRLAVQVYRMIKITGLSNLDDFGLDKANRIVDFVPIHIQTDTKKQKKVARPVSLD